MVKFSGLVLFILALALPSLASAHFGAIIPSRAMVMDKKEAALKIEVGFIHPFARQGMDMIKPEKLFVRHDGKDEELTEALSEMKFFGERAWQTDYAVKTPGVYTFASIPKPYYEAAEDSFIIHYAKTTVAAFGEEDGWDEPLGLPIEIIPLTRPFGNYAGNVFAGKALYNGKPLPNASVEVENLNRDGLREAPNAYFETQTVKTDSNGVFVYGVPWPGWWGFAVLAEGPDKIERDGELKSVELGGIIWVQFAEPLTKK
ncbi:MAG: DUF4198 domain-containing protein [Desulfovibrio sp.]|nr:DUF4198 domain-containing protein [Desulfovibrio sp.]